MKRVLTVLVCIGLLTIATSAFASVDVTFNVHGNWQQNSIVTVDVQIHNNGGSQVLIQGLELHFNYDSAKYKTLPEWYGPDAFVGNLVVDEKDLSTAGRVSYRKAKRSGYNMPINAGQTMTVYSLKFKVTGNASGATPFTFDSDIDDVANTDGESVLGTLFNTTNNIQTDTTAPLVEASPISVTMNAVYSPKTVTLRVQGIDESGDLQHIRYTTDGTEPSETGPNGSIYSAPIALSEGFTTIKFYGRDLHTNESSIQTETYTVDTLSPTFTALSAVPSIGKEGTIVTVSFETAEALGAAPSVQVAGGTATQFSKVGNAYVYRYTLQGTETEGTRNISVSVQDPAGNTTTNSTLQIYVDFTSPTYSPLSISPTPVVASQTVTVIFRSSEQLTIATTVSIMDRATTLDSVSAVGDGRYDYTFTTLAGLTGTENTALIVVHGFDAAGNSSQNTDGWGNVTITGSDVLGNEGTSTGNLQFIIEGQ